MANTAKAKKGMQSKKMNEKTTKVMIRTRQKNKNKDTADTATATATAAHTGSANGSAPAARAVHRSRAAQKGDRQDGQDDEQKHHLQQQQRHDTDTDNSNSNKKHKQKTPAPTPTPTPTPKHCQAPAARAVHRRRSCWSRRSGPGGSCRSRSARTCMHSRRTPLGTAVFQPFLNLGATLRLGNGSM